MHTDLDPTPRSRHRIMAVGYDLLNTVLWLPGGSDRLRRRFVTSLELVRGSRVLELGCGTGLVTRHLCAAGVEVVAIDQAPAMLAAARRRAPQAAFVTGNVSSTAIDGEFERVVLGFILHELAPGARVHVLRRSARVLAPQGSIGILEWARPAGCIGGRVWASVVGVIEPLVAHDVLDHGLDDAVAAAGLAIRTDQRVAGGRARIVRVGR
jgi:ubiquinone/menaquinone biosynthesis C-methylase UbiE